MTQNIIYGIRGLKNISKSLSQLKINISSRLTHLSSKIILLTLVRIIVTNLFLEVFIYFSNPYFQPHNINNPLGEPQYNFF